MTSKMKKLVLKIADIRLFDILKTYLICADEDEYIKIPPAIGKQLREVLFELPETDENGLLKGVSNVRIFKEFEMLILDSEGVDSYLNDWLRVFKKVPMLGYSESSCAKIVDNCDL